MSKENEQQDVAAQPVKTQQTKPNALDELLKNGAVELVADTREELAKEVEQIMKSAKGGKVLSNIVSELGWSYSIRLTFIKD